MSNRAAYTIMAAMVANGIVTIAGLLTLAELGLTRFAAIVGLSVIAALVAIITVTRRDAVG